MRAALGRFSPLVALFLTIPVVAQEPFRNLDFEMVRQPLPSFPGPGGETGYWLLPFSDMFPHWQGVAGGISNPDIRYGIELPNSPQLAIYPPYSDGGFPIGGNFSAMLNAYAVPPFSGLSSAELYQSGFIPESAKSILFVTQPFRGGFGEWGGISLLINGQAVQCYDFSGGRFPTTWGADVSEYAGTTAEIRFSLHTLPNASWITVGLDDIVFSPAPIPEPSTLTLTLLSLGLVSILECKRKIAHDASFRFPKKSVTN